MSTLNLMRKIGGVPLYINCPVALTAESLHSDLHRSGYMSVRTAEEQKYLFLFSCSDFTASFDSDEVLSAGDLEFNLFMLNTTISEDLSNKSAKSTHPRHFPLFFSLFGDYFQRVETRAQEVLHISNSPERLGCTATRWQSIFAFPRLVSSLDVKLMWR